MKKTTIKEELASMLVEDGYDFITACELISDCIREFKESGKNRQRFNVGDSISFILEKTPSDQKNLIH